LKLSIITVNFNNLQGLKNTVESVINQTFHDYEYIIIDGGSADGSIEYIYEMQEHFKYFKCESDSGIYNAMNKGILKANGKYLLFLNSGDILLKSNILENIIGFLNTDFDIYYGNQIISEVDGTLNQYKYPSKLFFSFFFNSSLPHQATLIKSDLFKIHGLYDEKYKIVSDWKFFFHLIVYKKVTYKYIDIDICLFEQGGLNYSQRKLGVMEREEIFRQEYPLFYDDIVNFRNMRTRIKYIENSKLFVFSILLEKFKNWVKNF